ncbi:MAG: glutamine amidotransferase-related protein [Dongiaceae bacterium]
MANRILHIKHGHEPQDDRTATHLAERGFALDWRHPFAGEALPASPAGLAGLVVHGGSQPVTETDRYPFLRDEMRLIGQCLKADVPVLGICLGGQLLAYELGAAVGPHPDGYHEFGYYELFPTAAGQAEFPAGLHVVQSHFHEFGLPAGATLLARSELFARQAFRYGAKAYGVQFHAEVTPAIFRRWQSEDWGHYGRPGVPSKEQQDRDMISHDAAQHRWFTGFLDRLFGRTTVHDAPSLGPAMFP